jgi:hypothetical protein
VLLARTAEYLDGLCDVGLAGSLAADLAEVLRARGQLAANLSRRAGDGQIDPDLLPGVLLALREIGGVRR